MQHTTISEEMANTKFRALFVLNKQQTVSQKSLDSVGHMLNIENQMDYAALCTRCILYFHFTYIVQNWVV
jgi:hypothetical protein